MRRTKLTEDMIQRIASLIRVGNYIEVVCRHVGISRDTYYRWLKEGEKDYNAGRKTLLARFYEEIMKAEADAEIMLVSEIRKKAREGDLKAAMFILQRRFHERWGAHLEERLMGGPTKIEIEFVPPKQKKGKEK